MAKPLQETRAFVRRPGAVPIHVTRPGAIVAKLPDGSGFIIAHPDHSPYVLLHDGKTIPLDLSAPTPLERA